MSRSAGFACVLAARSRLNSPTISNLWDTRAQTTRASGPRSMTQATPGSLLSQGYTRRYEHMLSFGSTVLLGLRDTTSNQVSVNHDGLYRLIWDQLRCTVRLMATQLQVPKQKAWNHPRTRCLHACIDMAAPVLWLQKNHSF
jgi:hypothetical protein